jgi:hypothetical protein
MYDLDMPVQPVPFPPPISNRESWELVVRSFDEYPDDSYWNHWRSVMRPLINRAIQAGYNELFLAGPAMYLILFSTMDRYWLRSEPRVSVGVTEDWCIQVYYSTTNVEFNSPIETSKATPDEAFNVLTRYLQRLWTETVAKPLREALSK